MNLVKRRDCGTGDRNWNNSNEKRWSRLGRGIALLIYFFLITKKIIN